MATNSFNCGWSGHNCLGFEERLLAKALYRIQQADPISKVESYRPLTYIYKVRSLRVPFPIVAFVLAIAVACGGASEVAISPS